MGARTLKTVVLYVEDEPNDVLFMIMAFRKAGLGASLQPVGDGRDAIDYLAGKGGYADHGQHPLPSLVLLDLNLPVVSGFEVLQWLKEEPDLNDMPVVVFSSSAREEDKVKARALGARDFIAKPSSPAELEMVVQGLKAKWLSGASVESRQG